MVCSVQTIAFSRKFCSGKARGLKAVRIGTS